MRALRERAAAAMLAGEPWQWTMDRLRPHGEALWRSLCENEQRRFLRHAIRFWDIHRHRIAPAVAVRIEDMRAAGQLHVHAGHVQSIVGEGVRCRVRFRPRHEIGSVDLDVRHVLNSTGVETRLSRMPSTLMQNLAARGMIAPGPHQIGLATDDLGTLLAADGTHQANLFTLGASRIGHSWESIAVPELRRQAHAISQALLIRLPADRVGSSIV
jgi:uncharacterized NAD(P)/FAD-binding protein YdhS